MGLRSAVKYYWLSGWGGAAHVPATPILVIGEPLRPPIWLFEAYAKYLRLRLSDPV